MYVRADRPALSFNVQDSMGTSTFGYNSKEDRIWVSNSAWKERIWITRRQVQDMLGTLARTLEQAATGEGDSQELAGRAHDAAINHAPAGTSGKPLQLGRDTAAQAAEADYLLCTGMLAIRGMDGVQVQLQTPQGTRVIKFDVASMHRWAHALLLVIRQADWDLPQVPAWLARSYLPPALQAILDQPLPGLEDEDPDDEGYPPALS